MISSYIEDLQEQQDWSNTTLLSLVSNFLEEYHDGDLVIDELEQWLEEWAEEENA